MATAKVDCRGLRCPQPILKIAAKSAELNPGDTLEATADCPTFEKDVRHWCERTKKTLMWIKDDEGGKKRCEIQF